MTGRERVRACLTFNSPDRVPRDLWALPYVSLFQKGDFSNLVESYPLDICTSQISPGWNEKVIRSTASVGYYTDDWGSVWYVGEPGVIGEVKKPILSDWSELKKFNLPWHLIRNRDIDFINKSCEKSEMFMLSDVTARPFERIQFLRGTENTFCDLAYGTKEFQSLLSMVHDFYLEDIRSWCNTSVDGIVFMDDWGSNNTLLVDPKTWREIFKPLYREYCTLIHEHKKFAFFHTDGHTEQIFKDFLEVGIDAINSQLFTINIEELARKYRGKITFWGEIDRQHILPFGKPEDVFNAVIRLRKVLDDGTGGVIAQCEWGKNNPIQNIKAVFEAWDMPRNFEH